jgi:hypothetical protein
MSTTDRALANGTPIADVTEEDVLAFLLEELTALLER